MPWTAQVSKTEGYVQGASAAGVWGKQNPESETYTKNELFALILNNEGERIFSINGLSVLSLLAIETLWIKQVVEGETWI